MTCHNRHCSYTPPHGCHDCPPPGVCPDYTTRRHDTKPAFKVKIEDCDGPMDLNNLVLEASMWAKGRLKKHIQPADTFFALADNIGFEQIMVGDIILVDRPRLPEQMLVIGFDEENYLVEVQRGYHGTTPQTWKRGTHVRIIKFMGATAQTEMVFRDIIQIDGTTRNELTDSFLVYEWGSTDTCLAGCYYLEFKLLKMFDVPAPPSCPSRCPKIPSVIGNPGPPQPYCAYGPVAGGPEYGPVGPYVPKGDTFSPGVYGIPGTNNPPEPPRPHRRDRDDRVLEHEYLYNDERDTQPGIDRQRVVSDPYPDQGNSPTTELFPEPLSIDAGANPQYYNPGGVEQFFMPHLPTDIPSRVQFPSCVEFPSSAQFPDCPPYSLRTEPPFCPTPSFTSPSMTPASFGCGLAPGVEWVRRFPVGGEGFLIHITDSPTAEL